MGAILHFGMVLAGLSALFVLGTLVLAAIVGILIIKTYGTGK